MGCARAVRKRSDSKPEVTNLSYKTLNIINKRNFKKWAKKEIMKKRLGFQLTVILLIGVLLLLCGHTHPHNYFEAAESCPLCQILQCGFTNVVAVALTLILISIILILPVALTPFDSYFLVINNSRASPVNLFSANF